MARMKPLRHGETVAAGLRSDKRLVRDRPSACGRYVVRMVGAVVNVFTLEEAVQLRAPPGCIALPLTHGYVALIDEADGHLAAHKWHTHFGKHGKIYAKRSVQSKAAGRQSIYLHRAVLGVTAREVEVDHENGDGLNCRRGNLREVTHTENMRNTAGARSHSLTGILGVSAEHHWRGKWRARIGKRTIGSYDTREEAVTARLDAEREEYGIQPRRAWAHEAGARHEG